MAFPLRFLIDECLSPDLESVASARGLEAAHVGRRGLLREPDWRLTGYCIVNDLIMVTNNAVDYRRLYRRLDLHPGLVIILPKALRSEQKALFDLVIDEIVDEPDLVNKLVEIDEQGLVTIREFNAPGSDGA